MRLGIICELIFSSSNFKIHFFLDGAFTEFYVLQMCSNFAFTQAISPLKVTAHNFPQIAASFQLLWVNYFSSARA